MVHPGTYTNRENTPVGLTLRLGFDTRDQVVAAAQRLRERVELRAAAADDVEHIG